MASGSTSSNSASLGQHATRPPPTKEDLWSACMARRRIAPSPWGGSMKSRTTARGKRVPPSHPDFNRRSDDEIIWLNELVLNAAHPERVPLIKISRQSLWATVGAGLFPRPAIRTKWGTPGWNLGAVRAWIRERDLLNPATASPYDAPDAVEPHADCEPATEGQSVQPDLYPPKGACTALATGRTVERARRTPGRRHQHKVQLICAARGDR